MVVDPAQQGSSFEEDLVNGEWTQCVAIASEIVQVAQQDQCKHCVRVADNELEASVRGHGGAEVTP